MGKSGLGGGIRAGDAGQWSAEKWLSSPWEGSVDWEEGGLKAAPWSEVGASG